MSSGEAQLRRERGAELRPRLRVVMEHALKCLNWIKLCALLLPFRFGGGKRTFYVLQRGKVGP